MKITLLMDTVTSWYYPFAQALEQELAKEHEVHFVHAPDKVPPGDCAFFLSCEKIIPKSVRDLNTHNIVVHSSNLPKGKGWSPMTWQILEGKTDIVNTLFEAVDAVDAGVIYLQNTMHAEGHELLPELHDIQGKAINALVLDFVRHYPQIISEGRAQSGEESFYPRRNKQSGELDPNKTIAEQFDLLRVVDNEQYPAFFRYRGHTYRIQIDKEGE